MKVVILAGGLGKRLRPFTEVIPKPLLPVGERSILEIQISRLERFGATEVLLATNYKSSYIEKFILDNKVFDIPVTVSREEEPLGTCGPLTLIKDRLTEPFMVMNGDILTNLDFRVFYQSATDTGTMLTVGTTVIHTPFEFGAVVTDGQYITSVQEKPEIKMEILAGIYVMRPGIFKYIPEKTYFGMDSLIKALLDDNEIIGRYPINAYWLDIGRPPDYERAQLEFSEHFDD